MKRVKQIAFHVLAVGAVGGLTGCANVKKVQMLTPKEQDAPKAQDAPKETVDAQPPASTLLQVPAGYRVELLVQHLTYPTSVTWDDQGRMYVAEAGGAFLEEAAPARILRIDGPGRATEIVNLDDRGIRAPVAGLVWHKSVLKNYARAARRRSMSPIMAIRMNASLVSVWNS